MRVLVISLAALLVLALVAFVLYGFQISELTDLWLNLGTEIVGIILTLLLVDYVIRAAEERKRRRFEQVALRSLTGKLRAHIGWLCKMFKAASTSIPNREEVSIQTVLREQFPIEMRHFNFKAPAPVHPEQTWLDYLPKEFEELKDKVEKVTEKYGPYLAPGLAEDLARIENSNLVGFITQLPGIKVGDEELGVKRSWDLMKHESFQSLLREHVDAILSVAERHDQVVDELKVQHLPDLLWRDDIGPALGSARVEESFGPSVAAGSGPPPTGDSN